MKTAEQTKTLITKINSEKGTKKSKELHNEEQTEPVRNKLYETDDLVMNRTVGRVLKR